MKRLVLGLVMASGLAFLAAPMANAANLGECGKSYAMEIHGAEPSTSNDSAVRYVAAIGSISFNAAGTAGPTGCTVSHLELMINDDGVVTETAGPAHCYNAGSLLGSGLPCFDGGTHQNVTGSITPLPFNGAQLLSIDPLFNWVNGSIVSGHLPLTFIVQANTGASTILGVSHADATGPTGAPPEGDALVITMSKQSTTAVLPVSGPTPAACGPYGCTGGGGNGYGAAPYLGLSISQFQGFGATPTNAFNLPGISATFGSTISVLQIFANGQAGGSVSFSSNDNVGNTTGVTEDDCDTQIFQSGNFADGTSNNVAEIVHPSLTCGDAAAGAAFTLSTVAWGATDTSNYSTVTGLTDTPDLGGALVPSGNIANAVGLSSVPAGKLTNLVAPTTAISTGTLKTLPIKWTNSSPAGCDVTMSMPPNSASVGTWSCSMSESNIGTLVEGDTPSTQYGTINCTCTGTGTTAANPVSITSPLTLSSSDCPNSGSAGATITCKN